MIIDSAIERLETVLLNPSLTQEVPLFLGYHKRWRLESRRGIRYYFDCVAEVARVVGTKNKEVLDVGCGLGLTLICLSLLGCSKGVGVDISDEMIGGFRKILKFFPELDVSAHLGDWLVIDHDEKSFDVVILKEAISHIRDTKRLLIKISKVLRPKGVLFITDSNNDLFFLNRLGRQKAWKKSEYGPIESDQVRIRSVDMLPFFHARVAIIRGLYPTLDEKTIIMLAKKTQGMYGSGILRAVNEFLDGGRIVRRPSFPYRNPYTGEFPELGINPLKLVSALEQLGFDCEFAPICYPNEPICSNGAVIRNMIRPSAKRLLQISPRRLLPFVWPMFHILAVKSG